MDRREGGIGGREGWMDRREGGREGGMSRQQIYRSILMQIHR